MMNQLELGLGLLQLWGGGVLLHLLIIRDSIWKATRDSTILVLALCLIAMSIITIYDYMPGDL